MKNRILLFSLLCFVQGINAQKTIANAGNLQIHPNANVAIYGNLSNTGSFNSVGGTVSFVGTAIQSIVGSNAPSFFNLVLNNSNGLILDSGNNSIANSLNLTNGNIYSNSSNLLVVENNATLLGGSNLSYVDGPIQKKGVNAFCFPVGKSGNYQPICISAPSVASDAFTAEYFNSNPRDLFGPNSTAALSHVSGCEYWQLDPSMGSSTPSVSLSWNGSSCGVTEPADLAVARWNGSSWEDYGNGGVSGNPSSGSVSSAGASPNFGTFTLGSYSGANQLPIKLVYFNAVVVGKQVQLNWHSESERNSAYYEIEKSSDAVNFQSIGKVTALGNSDNLTVYESIDPTPYRGISYYRLKMVDKDGSFEYSVLRAVNFQGHYELSIGVYPNPNNGRNFNLNINADKDQEVSITIYDNCGKNCHSAKFLTSKDGQNSYSIIPTTELSSGAYLIRANIGNQQSCIEHVVVY